jgi:hypothetical protein
MRQLTAKIFLPLALLCAVVTSLGGRSVLEAVAQSEEPARDAKPDATGTPGFAPADSAAAQSHEPPKDRPVYDPDIYDEDTTVYAGLAPARGRGAARLG